MNMCTMLCFSKQSECKCWTQNCAAIFLSRHLSKVRCLSDLHDSNYLLCQLLAVCLRRVSIIWCLKTNALDMARGFVHTCASLALHMRLHAPTPTWPTEYASRCGGHCCSCAAVKCKYYLVVVWTCWKAEVASALFFWCVFCFQCWNVYFFQSTLVIGMVFTVVVIILAGFSIWKIMNR